MIRQNTTYSESANGIARYFIAQHMKDVFRREPRNIGVFVEKANSVVSRFMGENETGAFGGRMLSRVVSSQKAYRVWVRHWRKAVQKDGAEAINRIMLEGAPEFAIVFGGEVTETGLDTAEAICDYLYSVLVSGGGLTEALGDIESDQPTVELKSEIIADLRLAGLMASNPQDWVRSPVQTDQDVRGGRYWHHVSIYQESAEERWAVEPLNFATIRKQNATERAGFLAHVFDDLIRSNSQETKRVNTVAVIRARPEDLSNKTVEYALSMIRDTGTNIVDYFDTRQRQQFISDRERVASQN